MVKIAVTIELCEQPLMIIIINGTWCGKNGANNEKKIIPRRSTFSARGKKTVSSEQQMRVVL